MVQIRDQTGKCSIQHRDQPNTNFGAGKPLEIVEVDLEGPKVGEVLVEIKATGVCHTDAFTLSGDDPEGAFPAILGHEGAGALAGHVGYLPASVGRNNKFATP